MDNERTFLVNGTAIVAGRRAKGFPNRAAFFRHLESRNLPIGRDTLDRCEKSPTVPHRAYLGTLELIASELNITIEALIVHDATEPGIKAGEFRNCSGIWQVTGRDLIVDGHFEYPNGPKNLEARVTVKVDVERRKISAEGRDHDEDPLSFQGSVLENGNHIVGQYAVENHRLHVYGTLNLQFHSCGRRMTGFYMGRETGQGSTFILGELLMEFLADIPAGVSDGK